MKRKGEKKKRGVSRPVTKCEELYVSLHYRDMTSAEIAKSLGCDRDRIDYIERILGLRKYVPWTPAKSKQLEEL